MRVAVVRFPGSLDDDDAAVAVADCGGEAVPVWHADPDLPKVDAVILPGGFSYGDHLRSGAIAGRAAIMPAISAFAVAGGPVLGICNGFQVLCEAGLLPGALLPNIGLRFVCRDVLVTIEQTDTPWTRSFTTHEQIVLPVKHGEGRYYADEETLDALEDAGRVVMRYARNNNPNGSARDIAGITNEGRNVIGLMPHPEHAVDAMLMGGADGRRFFTGLLDRQLEPQIVESGL